MASTRANAAGFLAATLAVAYGTIAQADDARPLRAGPVVELDASGGVAGCGVRFVPEGADDVSSIALVARKSATGVMFHLEAIVTDRPGLIAPRTITLQTASHDTRALTGIEREPGRIAFAGPLPGDEGAGLVRELMVSGGTVEIASDGEPPRRLSAPGPLPQLVRASYLNCAGDLYRPGE